MFQNSGNLKRLTPLTLQSVGGALYRPNVFLCLLYQLGLITPLMPSEYSSTARALALPVSPPRSPKIPHQSTQAPWTRRRSSQSLNRNTSQRRGPSSVDGIINYAERLWRQSLKTVEKMTPIQIAASILLGIITIVLAILFLVFSERIFAWLEPVAEKWKNLKGGWLILWLMCFATAFPPIIGYSTCLTLAGFVYGFPWG